MNNSFFGNDTETFYISAKQEIWQIEPDISFVGNDGLPTDATPVPETCLDKRDFDIAIYIETYQDIIK